MEGIKVISELNPKSPMAEAFRILRTNLRFTAVDKPYKSLLITSAGPSEGKSTTIANLGTVMAQAGVRVIIVDCDLRKAQQHKMFGLNNDMGMTNILVGAKEIDQVIKETDIPNLRVITSGPFPPNPAELLGSEKMKAVFRTLDGMADIVLVDSPPVLMVADAALISSLMDGVIMVIRAAVTKIDAVKQALEHLKKANARVIGSVLNSLEGSSGQYYYYGDSYYGEQGRKKSATTGG